MKRFFLLLIIFLPLTQAIQITEIELNPAGDDAGNEWIEFYSEGNFEIKIINNDGDERILNISEGYFIYEFDKQWLDNSNEKLFLYRNDKLIQETIMFEDNKNDDQTFSLCDSWKLTVPTKNKENNCNQEQQKEQVEDKHTSQINFSSSTKKIREPVINDPITINPKTIKTKNNFSIQGKEKYSIIIFCIVLAILMLRKKNKTEFK